MKYKVGDKVKVRENLKVDKMYGNQEFVPKMNGYKGQKATILGVHSNCYDLDIDNRGYYWTDEMLEPVAENIAESDENTDEVVNTSVETIDKNGQKDKKSTVKSGQFTKEDFKFGDIVTLRNGEQGIKSGIRIDFDSGEYHYLDEFTDVFLYEPAYSLDEFTDVFLYEPAHSDLDIMKVERYIKNQNGSYDLVTLYERKEEILTEEEKEYLSAVIKPFRDKVKHIKCKSAEFQVKDFIVIDVQSDAFFEDLIDLPFFERNTMYKGMTRNKEYTLEELGL